MPSNIAVLGAACAFHDCEDVAAFAGALRRGRQSVGLLSRNQGETPADVQQAVFARMARAALRDAKASRLGRVLVVAVGETNEGLLPAPSPEELSQIFASAAPGPHEPAKGVVANTAYGALRLAAASLTSGEADAVLILAVTVLAQPASDAAAVDGFSAAFEASGAAAPAAEGAAALLLSRPDTADLGRAHITGLAEGERAGARGFEQAMEAALSAPGWRPGDVGLLSVIGKKATAVGEATAFARVYAEGPRETALSCVRANFGDAGSASDLAGVIGSVLCLERAMTPPLAGWSQAGPVALRQAGGLYATSEARLWMTSEASPHRRALVALEAEAGRGAALALEAGPTVAPVAATAVCADRPLLFPLIGPTPEAVEAEIAGLETGLAAGEPLPMLSRRAMGSAAQTHGAHRLAIVAGSRKELDREIGFMRRGMAKALSTGKSVRTPNGSVYTPAPIAAGEAKIAFVFPGNGSAYINMGREILLSFARHTTSVEPILNRRLPILLRTDLTYPKSLARFTEADEAAFTEELHRDAASLPLVSIAFGVVHSLLLRGVLGVNPHMAMGYSIGELAMRIALGQWSDWRALEQRLNHPCLHSGLCGKMTAVDAYWAQQGGAPASGSKWAAHVLKANPEEIAAATDEIPNVYVTAINTPDEVVIAGAPDACQQLMMRTGALGLPLEFSVAIHAPPAQGVRDQLHEICDNPLRETPDIAFYSAHNGLATPESQSAVADTLSNMLASRLDFRRLVEAVYADGARIFIETGVRNNCTNWISATLADRPHLAVAMDVKGLASDVAFMRAVAQLYANHVAIDFSELVELDMASTAKGFEKLLESVQA